MDRAARILTSAGFVAGLAVLLANDLVLKHAHPGLLTGKLSDFAGLFVFPMFCAALWRRRTRGIYVATALAFAWWKSPLSQGAIDDWNDVFGYQVARVVDVTDLIALAVLPVSFGYLRHVASRRHGVRRPALPLIMLISLLAFGGSLCTEDGWVRYNISPEDPSATYELAVAPGAFADRLDESGLFHSATFGASGDGANRRFANLVNVYSIRLDTHCREALVDVTPSSAGTMMRLIRLTQRKVCKSMADLPDLRLMFEEEVIARLNMATPPKQATVDPDVQPFDYPPDQAPLLEVAGSRDDVVRRLDKSTGSSHEFHDGVYQLGAVACNARFRISEEPDRAHVVITGIGYSTPCFWGTKQECLEALFRQFFARDGDPTPSPVPSAPATTARERISSCGGVFG